MANSTDYKVVFSGQDNVSGTIKKVKGELDSVGKTAQTATDKIDKQFNRIINSSAPLKRQLKDLQSLMAEMNFKGLSNTEQFTKIATEAGRIKDAINDASAATQRFANDTMGLQAGIQAMQGLAAAGSVASGVMGLLGTKNSEVQRAILKVQSAMAILNGVQSIANMLNKDSILMHKLKAIRLQTTAAMTTKDTVATTANTVATNANTAAQKGWNMAKAIGKAMLGDFTGLLLIGGTALLGYSIFAGDASDEQDKLNNSLGEGTTFLDKQTEASKEAAKEINEEKNRIYALKSILDDTNVSYDNKVKALNELKKIIPSVNGMIDSEGVYHGNAASAIREHIKALADLQTALALFKMEQKIQEELVEAEYKEFQADEEVKRHENNIKADEAQIQKSGEISHQAQIQLNHSIDPNLDRGAVQDRRNQAFKDARQAQENKRTNQEKLEVAKEEQKAARQEKENIQQQKQQLGRFAQTKHLDPNAVAAAKMSGGNASKAADIFFNRDNIEKGGGGTGAKGTTRRGGTTTNKPTKTENKPEAPKAVEGSLDDLQKKYNALKDNIRKGLFSSEEEGGQAKDLETLKNLEKQIESKEIELGFKIDPDVKAKEELQKDLDKLSKEYGEIQLTPSFSSYQQATGQASFDTSTLEGLQQQMDFNDSLINQYQTIIDKYEELGETGSEAYNKVKEAMQGVMDANSEYAEQATDIYNKQKEHDEYYQKVDAYAEGVSNLGAAFSNLSGALDESTQKTMQFVATSLQGLAEIFPTILRLIGAKQAQATASGVASAAEMPFPYNLAAIASVVATIASIFASIPKFAEGGIVGGGPSMYGDKILTRLNPGEMVLNKHQQRNLFDMLDNGGVGGSSQSISFRIKGSDLYGTLKNFSKTQSKVGKTTGII